MDKITATVYEVTKQDKNNIPLDGAIMAARRKEDLYWIVLEMLKDFRVNHVVIRPLRDLEEREV